LGSATAHSPHDTRHTTHDTRRGGATSVEAGLIGSFDEEDEVGHGGGVDFPQVQTIERQAPIRRQGLQPQQHSDLLLGFGPASASQIRLCPVNRVNFTRHTTHDTTHDTTNDTTHGTRQPIRWLDGRSGSRKKELSLGRNKTSTRTSGRSVAVVVVVVVDAAGGRGRIRSA
jgi:hypothetical protein